MKLNEEEKKKVESHFKDKWKNKKCPLCGNSNWILSDKVFEIREFHGGDLIIGKESAIFPVILLTCSNCSYTASLNAIKLGLLKDDQTKKDKKKD